ncbi:MAG: hypothetical protein HYS80_00145, partial [Candidatus Aenigmarchaeota archaeon]|nr:hypothetical protein [Candidatus Aenigmarchaeota archaeon]
MKKGQQSAEILFSVTIAVLLAGILLPAIPLGQATKIAPEVQAKEFENKAIILANSFLDNPDLIYSDSYGSYHGMFDTTNFENIFYESDSDSALYTCKPNLSNCKLPTYPETFALVIVVDIENDNGWFTGTHRLTGSESQVTNIISCFQNRVTINYPDLFKAGSYTAEVLELDNCNLHRYSHLNLVFPVSLR